MVVELIAQGISLLGMAMNVLSFQRKEQRQIIFMQLIGSTFFGISYLMIGAYVGGLLNAIGMIRAVAYWQREKFHAEKIYWVYGIAAASLCIYALSFVVFGTEPSAKNLTVELLPAVAMVLSTVSFYLGSARAVRFLGIACSPLWLTYNVFNFNIGGIITESIALVSIFIGILRYDLKKGEEKSENAES